MFTDYWRGECPDRGKGGSVKGVKYTPMPPGMYKNVKKMGGFTHILAFKLPKMPLFAQKYLTRYTPETFFEECINLKIFLLLNPKPCGYIN